MLIKKLGILIRNLATLIAVVVSLFLASAKAHAEPQAFTAQYGVFYLGLRAAEVSLTLVQEDDSWTMKRSSRAAGVARWLAKDKLKIDETSQFYFDNNEVKPMRYVQDKPGDKRGRRHIEIIFTTDNALVTTDTGDKTIYTVKNTHDQLSAVIAVMQSMELQNEDKLPSSFELSILGRRGEDVAKFKYIDHETLKTPAGEFETIHLEQNNKKRTTDYWLAIGHNMVPVKIVHQEEEEKSAEMLLEKLRLNAQ